MLEQPVTNTTKIILGSIAAGLVLFFTGMFFLGKSRARTNMMKSIAKQIVEKNIQPTEPQLVEEFKFMELDTEDAKKILGMVREIREEKTEEAKKAKPANKEAKKDAQPVATQPAGDLQNDTNSQAS